LQYGIPALELAATKSIIQNLSVETVLSDFLLSGVSEELGKVYSSYIKMVSWKGERRLGNNATFDRPLLTFNLPITEPRSSESFLLISQSLERIGKKRIPVKCCRTSSSSHSSDEG